MNPEHSGGKKYGLIIPSKQKKNLSFLSSSSEVKKTVFKQDTDSDEDLEADEGSLDWRSKTTSKSVERSMQRNQARQAALKALEEDPTVFQYDEIYDSIEQQKEQEKPKKVEKKPKYIANLLRTAEQRKVENERRVERKVQKEREAEGDMFHDKEAFITPAYRAKLAELKKAEEEEKKKEQMEAFLDVTKQRDMSGFYRHLFQQKFAEQDKEQDAGVQEEKASEEPSSKPNPEKKERQYRRQRRESPSPTRENISTTAEEAELKPATDSDHFSDEDVKTNKKKPETKKRDETSAALLEARDKETRVQQDASLKERDRKKEKSRKRSASRSPERRDRDKLKSRRRSSTRSPEPVEKENQTPKVKVDIWKKRTVGEVFESALQRYLERKEARKTDGLVWPLQ